MGQYTAGIARQMETAAEATQRHLADTQIMQKVNAVNREAFAVKYPGQVEHCLRLVMERLQAGLDKRGDVVIDDTRTWRMSTVEILDLAHSAKLLNEIRRGF